MKNVQIVTSKVPESNNLRYSDNSTVEKLCLKSNKNDKVDLVVKTSPKKNTDGRTFYINNSQKNKEKYNYVNNYVKTSKYTWYDFLPKSLLLQFSRTANIYFLLIMIIQCIPIISPLNSATAIFPLIVVLSISMIRELMEDIQRHKHDDKENNILVNRYDNKKGLFLNDVSKNINVGDIILLNENNVIPADCVLLSCSNFNRLAYIETANLDGEKDLKAKNCLPQVFKYFREGNEVLSITGKITCNKPVADLQKFSGKIEFSLARSFALSVKQFLYKGTKLKNTKWALGVAVYTGKESKVILNSQKGKPKQSDLENTVNKLILIIFGFQVTLCILLSILHSEWYISNKDKATYLALGSDSIIINNVISGGLSFFTYLLLLNTMIPISLIVTLEIVKYSQAYFMNNDCDMYSQIRTSFANCNSCSLNEELGQIKYIFSDKTGTLTANKLEFKAAAIGEKLYGLTLDDLKNNELTSGPFPDSELKDYIVIGKTGKSHGCTLVSDNGKATLKLDNTKDVVMHYFYCLSLNNTIMVEKKIKPGKIEVPLVLHRPIRKTVVDRSSPPERVDTKENTRLAEHFEDYDIFYRGQNPDEIVLANFAKGVGFIFLGGDESVYNLKVLRDLNGHSFSYEDQKFEILKILEFSSERGMMSIIVKQDNVSDSKIILYTKGGDSKVQDCMGTNQPFKSAVKDNADKLASAGLRVLWIAMKIIDQQEFNSWNNLYQEGLKNIINDEEKKVYNKEKYALLEKNLTLIGCTAVEDKLQDKVPQTIKELQTAGINVWVLTGDNLPTAKIIALRCNLLPENMDVYELNEDLSKLISKVTAICGKTQDTIFSEKALKTSKSKIQKFETSMGIEVDASTIEFKAHLYLALTEIWKKYEESEKKDKGVLRGILVESYILKMVLPLEKYQDIKYYGHPLTRIFLMLTLNSQAVVCCRVAPQQKALVVRMVKRNIKGAITLAVGDGANDVNMILEANVGVGILGEEGSQAALSSDYSIGEFRFLRKLILVHGRLNYIRIAEMILYFFFKNFIFTIPQFYFAYFNGFSGQTLYDDWYVSFYNMCFTALPLIFKALFEQDFIEADGQFINSNLAYTYYLGREGIIFNFGQFLLSILQAVLESIIVFFFTTYMLHYEIIQNSQGFIADHWSNSLTQFTAIIIVNFFNLDR
jgi:magnesium-transporting ATPase (P-type)